MCDCHDDSCVPRAWAPLPGNAAGDSLLFATGALAATRALNIVLAVLAVFSAAVLGDAFNFYGTQHGGSKCRALSGVTMTMPTHCCMQPHCSLAIRHWSAVGAVGRAFGGRAMRLALVKREHLAQTERYYEKYGAKTGGITMRGGVASRIE